MDDDGKSTHTNQMDVMVDRCKRWYELTVVDNDTGVNTVYEDKLFTIWEEYCFSESAYSLGHKLFDRNTPNILSGWNTRGGADYKPVGGFCILVSTMNLTLNHDRDILVLLSTTTRHYMSCMTADH